MREIKFRAWNKKEKRMFNMNNVKSDLGLYFNYTTRNYREENKCVNRFIQMQYTGLKDVNDVEIYEDDIFHLGDKNIKYVVEYVDCGLKGKQLGTNSYIGLTYWKDKIQILGNVYETPKLLEDKK